MKQVILLDTDKILKAAILCEKLLWQEVTFTFKKIEGRYQILIDSCDLDIGLM